MKGRGFHVVERTTDTQVTGKADVLAMEESQCGEMDQKESPSVRET